MRRHPRASNALASARSSHMMRVVAVAKSISTPPWRPMMGATSPALMRIRCA